MEMRSGPKVSGRNKRVAVKRGSTVYNVPSLGGDKWGWGLHDVPSLGGDKWGWGLHDVPSLGGDKWGWGDIIREHKIFHQG